MYHKFEFLPMKRELAESYLSSPALSKFELLIHVTPEKKSRCGRDNASLVLQFHPDPIK